MDENTRNDHTESEIIGTHNSEEGGGESLFDFIQRIKTSLPDTDGSHDNGDIESELDADDYHNKATEFARKNKNKMAAEICIEGLKKYANNVDLLADVIKYSSDAGDAVTANEYFACIMQLPRIVFNWRAYTFVLDYLMKNAASNEDICRELIADYRKYLPYEEKSYVAESTLEFKLGNFARSQTILEEAITIMPNAPQAALRLADICLKKGRFEEVVRIVNYAMMASAETQSTINIPYIVYIRCLAQDALLHKKAMESGCVPKAEVEYVRDRYELLKKAFPVIRMNFESTIINRIWLLSFIETC